MVNKARKQVEEVIQRLAEELGDQIQHHPVTRRGHGKASFSCRTCPGGNKWTSYDALFLMNRVELVVFKWYQQKCKKCKSLAKPYFSSDELEKQIRQVLLYKKGRSSTISREHKELKESHQPQLCEACNFGLVRLH